MIEWLKRTFGLAPSARVPKGWTDDMTVALPPDGTCADVVKLVLSSALQKTPDTETERLLIEKFKLSPEDASLARDRAFCGLVRSAMQDSALNKSKDPISWESYRQGLADPTLVQRIYPQSSV